MANETWTPKSPSRSAHPDRLHVIGRLFGLEPPPVQTSRILEIGCRDGGHLLGLASAYPHAELVGLDSSPAAIEVGATIASRARLSNIRFDLLDVIESLAGPFDYVIAELGNAASLSNAPHSSLHHVRRLLSAEGIALIEYPTRPGHRLEELVFSILRRHVQNVEAPSARVGQARALLRALLDAAAGGRGIELFRPEVERVAKLADPELGIALDGEGYAPLFGEFVQELEAHGLAFVSEATLGDGSIEGFRGAPGELLSRVEGRLEREQYIDFLSGRRRRQSLVCHARASPGNAPLPARARGLFAMSPLVPSGALGEQHVRAPGGAELRVEDRVLYEIVCACGAEWPRSIPCSALLAVVTKRAPLVGITEHVLLERLVAGAERKLIELRSHDVPTIHGVPDRPFVPRLARVELDLGRPLTSHLHFSVVLPSSLARRLLPLLDGTQTQSDLATRLAADLEKVVEELRVLARAGLLVAPPEERVTT